MQAPIRRRTRWFAAMAGAIGLVVIAVVIVILISNHNATNSSVVGTGTVGETPTVVGSSASPTAGISPTLPISSSSPTSGPTAKARGSGTPARGRPQATGSATTIRTATSAVGAGSSASVVVCTSTDFDNKTNACVKADPAVSAGNGGLTVDGDVSFPDYMTGTITLLRKQGAGWRRLSEFSTKTYPDVVVIDSHSFISVQLANVFAYGGHRAMPACSSTWGIEVDDAQGLPLGDVTFVYTCK
jgi:hypothetical protein